MLIRKEQLQHLSNYLKECQFDDKSNIILSGDFNTDIDEVQEFVNTNLGLTYTFEKGANYNTENRLQYRNRDGQQGMDVIQRCVDGVFFNNKCVKLASKLAATKNFSQSIN